MSTATERLAEFTESVTAVCWICDGCLVMLDVVIVLVLLAVSIMPRTVRRPLTVEVRASGRDSAHHRSGRLVSRPAPRVEIADSLRRGLRPEDPLDNVAVVAARELLTVTAILDDVADSSDERFLKSLLLKALNHIPDLGPQLLGRPPTARNWAGQPRIRREADIVAGVRRLDRIRGDLRLRDGDPNVPVVLTTAPQRMTTGIPRHPEEAEMCRAAASTDGAAAVSARRPRCALPS